MKQAYEKAKAHVVLFDNSDVITTSGGYGSMENDGNGCDVKGNTKSQAWHGGKDPNGECQPAVYSHR